ncbi:Uncharacterized protein BN1183_CU_00060 [Pantoea ananatis]|nr:Uncharacterized protein BN1183_CU_00060 [Pantoea ananatis]
MVMFLLVTESVNCSAGRMTLLQKTRDVYGGLKNRQNAKPVSVQHATAIPACGHL